jgi:Tfp pilus assembly protein PilF
MYKQCIQASIQKNGERDPITLQYMNNLALLYMDQKKYKEAKKVFLKCIEIGSQVHGRHHPMVRQWKKYNSQIDGCVIM